MLQSGVFPCAEESNERFFDQRRSMSNKRQSRQNGLSQAVSANNREWLCRIAVAGFSW